MAFTPSLGSVTLTPKAIQVGPMMLWHNVDKPADGATLLVSGQASGSNDQRVFGPLPLTASGTAIGSTIGQSTIQYRPQFVDIDIEQALSPVEKVISREDAGLTASIAELTAENLRDVSIPGNLVTPVATLKSVDLDPHLGVSSQYRHTITMGGLRVVEPMCIVGISANRRINVTGGPFSYTFVGYNAVSTEGFDIPFQRSGTSVWRVRYEMLADIDRTIGDQLFQLTVRNSSAT